MPTFCHAHSVVLDPLLEATYVSAFRALEAKIAFSVVIASSAVVDLVHPSRQRMAKIGDAVGQKLLHSGCEAADHLEPRNLEKLK